MTDPFSQPSDFGGGAFFKAAEHMNHLAILFEPKTIAKGVPNTFEGVTKPRDEIIADVTIFDNQASIDSGTPTEVLKSAKVVAKYVVRDLEKVMGGAMLATIVRQQFKVGSGYVLRNVEGDNKDKVAEYFTKREAAVAEALDSAPGFD